MLGAGEDQGAIDRFLLQQLAKTAGLAEIDLDRALGDPITVEATGVTATRAGSRSIASASSAMSLGMVAEKNSRLPPHRQLGDDFAVS